MGFTLLFAIVVLLLAAFVSGLRVAYQFQRAVVFRLGRLHGIKGPGLYWLIPFGIDTQRKVDIRTLTIDIESQESITKDSVTIKVNAVVWLKITDPERAVDLGRGLLRGFVSGGAHDDAQHHRPAHARRGAQGARQDQHRTSGDRRPGDRAVGCQGRDGRDEGRRDPAQMQRAMAQEAQAQREKRARIIKAEAESEAAQKLADASIIITEHPLALELRRMQMITEVGAEQNTTTIVMMPSEFVTMAESLGKAFQAKTSTRAARSGE